MTQEVLRVVGQIAGIGGIALGVFLLLFREVIRKSVFPNLTKEQGYNLLRLIIVLVWMVALAGLASWVYVSKPTPVPPIPPTAKNVAERGVILVDLGYSLHAVSFALYAAERTGTSPFTNEIDSSRVNAELTELYRRLGLTMPDAKVGPDLVKATKSMLPDERDRQCLDIGMDIGAAETFGIGMIVRSRDTPFQEMGRQKMSEVSTSMRNTLQSFGILGVVENDGNIENQIVPMSRETIDAFVTRIHGLKASIIGAYRQRYEPIGK